MIHTWQKADHTDRDKLAIGLVTSVTDSDNFEISFNGPTTVNSHGLTVGEYYFTSTTTPGTITSTKQWENMKTQS